MNTALRLMALRRSFSSGGGGALIKSVTRRLSLTSAMHGNKNGSESNQVGEWTQKAEAVNRSNVILPGVVPDSQESQVTEFKEFGTIVKTSRYSGWSDFEELSAKREDPLRRIVKGAKFQKLHMVEDVKTTFGFEFESELAKHIPKTIFTDILIIGGGAIGSACAYWIKEKVREGVSVTVVERDPKYRTSTTCLTIDALRQRYSLQENIAMASYGADFIRSADFLLKVPYFPKLDIQYQPHGYLLLASKDSAEDLYEMSELQNSIGCRNLLMAPHRLRTMFPWLRTDDIALGCLGLGKEGWFDPWALTVGLRSKAMYWGTDYFEGEVVGFRFQSTDQVEVDDPTSFGLKVAAVLRPDGELTLINFSRCIVAVGAESGLMAKLMGIGLGSGMMKVPLPIKRKKRYMYCFHSPNSTRINTPIVVDNTGIGLTFRRDDLGGYYLVGVSPESDEEPVRGDNRVNFKLFFDEVLPQLVHRVPDFEKATLRAAWAGNYGHNWIDANGIIDRHPLLENIIFVCGFSEHGIHFAPALGRAVSEIIFESEFTTFDLRRFSFSRFVKGEEVHETKIM